LSSCSAMACCMRPQPLFDHFIKHFRPQAQ
jgi:hypothetical protein